MAKTQGMVLLSGHSSHPRTTAPGSRAGGRGRSAASNQRQKAPTMPDDVETNSIDRYRREIDEIDTELLRMLNRRAACAMKIGKIKKRNNLPIHVPEREEMVLKRLVSLNGGPVPAESVEAVFQTIFAQMRALEEDSD